MYRPRDTPTLDAITAPRTSDGRIEIDQIDLFNEIVWRRGPTQPYGRVLDVKESAGA